MPNGIESTLMLLMAATLVCLFAVRSCTLSMGQTLLADASLARRPREEMCALVVRAAEALNSTSAATCLRVLKGYWGAATVLALITAVVALNAVGDTPPSMWTRGAEGGSHFAACRPSYDTWFARTCLFGGIGLFGYTMYIWMRLTGLIATAFAAGHFGNVYGKDKHAAESWLEHGMSARRGKAREHRQQFVDSLFDPILMPEYETGAERSMRYPSDGRERQAVNRRGWPLG